MELKRVVVTGLGVLSPIGNDVATTWKNALAGVSGAGPITRFDVSKFKTQFGCELKGYDEADYFDRKEARKYDRYAQYAIVAANQAIADAKLDDTPTVDKTRVGVVVASGVGGIRSLELEAGNYAVNEDKGPHHSPFFILRMISNMASGHISILHGYHGPNYGIVAACASSTNAIIDSFNLIRMGKADVMVTGGAEAPISTSGIGGFNSMHALSVRNDDPQGASRPFSASRDGFVIGEGSAVLILEELEHAKKRGAKIYAEVVGGGMSADAYHMTASHPEGVGARLVMNNALDDAGISPDLIDYINVHGTSTPVGDVSEAKAIIDVFGKHAYDLNISSTKSMTGHLLGAAGALEALFCILAIVDNKIPPTINHADDDCDENIDYNLNFTFNKCQERIVNYALSNTFGFGGQNSCVIVKKYSE